MERSEFKSSTLLILAGALLAGLLGLYLGGQWSGGQADSGKFRNKVLLYPQGRPMPAFELEAATGQPLTSAQLAGRWTVMFFGFRNCPDICPTTLAQLAAVQRRLAERLPAERVPNIVFVSVDPARDTPAELASYVQYFNPALLAATRQEPELQRFTEQLGAQYVRQPADARGQYAVDHSADLFLIGPDGTRRGLIRPPFDTEGLSLDLEQLTHE